jgi:hypothetical protein
MLILTMLIASVLFPCCDQATSPPVTDKPKLDNTKQFVAEVSNWQANQLIGHWTEAEELLDRLDRHGEDVITPVPDLFSVRLADPGARAIPELSLCWAEERINLKVIRVRQVLRGGAVVDMSYVLPDAVQKTLHAREDNIWAANLLIAYKHVKKPGFEQRKRTLSWVNTEYQVVGKDDARLLGTILLQENALATFVSVGDAQGHESQAVLLSP